MASLNRTTLADGLALKLREAIVSGRYPLRSRLPSVRRLAAEYRVSTSVVSQAIRALTREGLVAPRQGSGTTVLAKPSPLRILVWTPRQEGMGNAATGAVSFVRFCITRGMTQAAAEIGIALEPIGSLGAAPLSLSGADTNRQDVVGVVLFEAHGQEEVVEKLARYAVPFVVAHTCRSGLPYRCIITDTAASFSLAVKELVLHGHRRIALIAPKPEASAGGFFSARLEGYRLALEQADIQYDDRLVRLVSEPTVEQTAELIRSLTDQGDPPTAFACGEDHIALSVLEALRTLGTRVPEDFSVVGYDDIVEAAESGPPLTTVHNPLEASGREAVRLLHRVLAGEEDVPRSVTLIGSLVRRSSCAPPP